MVPQPPVRRPQLVTGTRRNERQLWNVFMAEAGFALPKRFLPCLGNWQEPSMLTVLIVILVLLLVGVAPVWPYSSGWGYYPSGGLTLLLLVLVIFLLTGRA